MPLIPFDIVASADGSIRDAIELIIVAEQHWSRVASSL
jgi:hypothetical protein